MSSLGSPASTDVRTPGANGRFRRHRSASGGHVDPRVLAAIALGGALGAPARHAVAELVPTGSPAARFPWATFGVNVTGSLLLGFVLVLVLEHLPPSRSTRPFVATGLLGTYTTYSAFALETVQLVDEGRPGLGLAYVAASVTGGVVAAWVGMAAARLVDDRRGPA